MLSRSESRGACWHRGLSRAESVIYGDGHSLAMADLWILRPNIFVVV